MSGEGLDTHVEQTINAVNHYHKALQLAVKNAPTVTTGWPDVIENLAESLRILSRDKYGYEILTHWYDQLSRQMDIHAFVNELWALVLQDTQRLQSIEDLYFRRCIWELVFGGVLLIVPPVFFLLIVPLISNPVILAPVFILTCIMLPLIAHFLLICPAVEDFQASIALKTMRTSSLFVKSLYEQTFLSGSEPDVLKECITSNYDVLTSLQR